LTLRPDVPAPLRRRGPRPIWLHLAGAIPDPGQISAMPPATPTMLDRALLAGVAAYRRHPYRRELADPPAIWADGESRLLDYGPANATPVLFVPSLVNRAYVLDLLPERSMLRWLGANGIRPLLLDWGWPGPAERGFGLTDAIAGRLERALVSLGEPVVLTGYCMGGLLALAAALRQPARVQALALLATPWDFHAEQRAEAIRLGASLALFEPLLAATLTLPIDALQTLFAAVEPGAVAAKFRAFGHLDQASAAARDFVALEDWLNDGVPLAAPIAREVLSGWYRDNLPGTGQWRIGGDRVEPEALRCPTFVAVPSRDRIVPPGSALPLAERIPGAVLHRPAAGHISMTAGSRAEAELWQPLLDWLRGL
jgi:polyhydroxyalkanoate synthase subunit PhaC